MPIRVSWRYKAFVEQKFCIIGVVIISNMLYRKIGEDTNRMDEEVKLGKTEDLNRAHDITNGASDKQKINITYNFKEECKQIFSLARRHSRLYLIKFMFYYIFFLLFLSVLLLLFENRFFIIETEGKEAYISLIQFKWIMFLALESSTFSALVEAIVNIPEETLPSRQQKTGNVKLGSNIDTNSNEC